MQTPQIPPNEEERLAALVALEILDTPPEERFERLVQFAAALFRVPIAVVSLVDSDRQWFKAIHGLEAQQTSREISFCGHAILSGEPLVVEDACRDPRFADNPLVTGAPNIRFYAGHPLEAPDGSRVGTLCVIDRVPHSLSAEEVEKLKVLAGLVENELRRVLGIPVVPERA